MARLNTKLGALELKNPVILASGTAGFGEELEKLIDIKKIGAIVTKTITLNKREGNPVPRVAEAPAGLLNSIGLANPGFKDFMFNKIRFLEKIKVPVIVSIAGDSTDEFKKLTEELDRVPTVSAIELNLSCPNVVHKGTKLAILAQDPGAVRGIVRELRPITKKTLIVKLSPGVTDIKEIAKKASKAGADALSLINTYPAMLTDIDTMRPKLGGVTGGLSGPCIKPLALKCVWDVYNEVKAPIIGIGGIMTAGDAVEFMLCGASAVQIGTATFIDPGAALKVISGIERYLDKKKIKSVKELTGALKTN